jgi:hypothetical protein
MVEREFPGPLCAKVMQDLDTLSALGLRFASPELSDGGGAAAAVVLPPAPHTAVELGGDDMHGLAPLPRLTPTQPSPSGGAGRSANSLATRSMPPRLLQRNSFSLHLQQQQHANSSQPGGSGAAVLPPLGALDSLPLRTSQEQVLANLLRVRELVQVSRDKLQARRVNEFLTACSEGNWARIKTVSVHSSWQMRQQRCKT